MEEIRRGNCEPHQLDGQNIAYVDTHVKFEKTPFEGLNGDNIYLVAPPSGPTFAYGDWQNNLPVAGGTANNGGPSDKRDSVLVSAVP
jgi:hypothetical protein